MLYIVSKWLSHPSKDAFKNDLEITLRLDIFGTDFWSILGPFFGQFWDPKSTKKGIQNNINFGIHFLIDFGRFGTPKPTPAGAP